MMFKLTEDNLYKHKFVQLIQCHLGFYALDKDGRVWKFVDQGGIACGDHWIPLSNGRLITKDYKDWNLLEEKELDDNN